MRGKKEKHLLKIDKVCNNCGYRNKLNWIVDSHMNVIACGNCGDLLVTPDNISTEEKKVMREAIDQAIKEVKGE